MEKFNLFKVSEAQLRAMFGTVHKPCVSSSCVCGGALEHVFPCMCVGGFIALALSDQAHQRHRNSPGKLVSMAVRQAGFKLKTVTIRGWVAKASYFPSPSHRRLFVDI
jgi:hypothetical protein